MSVRVVQVIPRLDEEAGGPPVAAVATALALQERGARNCFAFPIDGRHPGTIEHLVGLLESRGIPVHAFRERRYGVATSRWGVSPRLGLWLLRAARRFDVVHVHMAWSFTALAGLVAARLGGGVAVMTPHESLTDYDRVKSGPVKALVKRLLRAFYVRSFDLVVVASSLERESLGAAGRRRSVVIAHAVEPEGPPPARTEVGGIRVGFLARLDPKKNLEVLVQALPLLPDSVTLRIAGDGPADYRASLVALASACRVEHRVEWLGFLDADGKFEFLGTIDILAMPSAFECFGVAAAEAMWAGIPVVVSDGVGLAEVVARYACGRVVAATVDDVSQAILELTDPEVRREASESAKEAARREFSRDVHGQRLFEAYGRLLRERRRGLARARRAA